MANCFSQYLFLIGYTLIMTETTRYKPKQRRNRFVADFNTEEDDFLLADVQVLADDTKLKITPLHHLVDDEDAIDRLLVNSGFAINTGRDQTEEIMDVFAVPEKMRLKDEIPTIDEIDPRDNEVFVLEPLIANTQDFQGSKETDHNLSVPDESALQTPAKTTPTTDFQANNSISAHLAMCHETETVSDVLETESNLKVAELIDEPEPVQITFQAIMTPEETPRKAENETVSESMSEHISEPHAFAEAPEIGELNLFKTELQNLSNQQKTRLHRYKNKAKKATLISYAALGLAIVALISTVTMGMMIADLNIKVSKLTALLEIVKDDIETLTEKDR